MVDPVSRTPDAGAPSSDAREANTGCTAARVGQVREVIDGFFAHMMDDQGYRALERHITEVCPETRAECAPSGNGRPLCKVTWPDGITIRFTFGAC